MAQRVFQFFVVRLLASCYDKHFTYCRRNGTLEQYIAIQLPEVESSRTHFEVLGLGLKGQVLGLEASSFSKLFCLQPRTALFVEA